jgi:hypothetical protein
VPPPSLSRARNFSLETVNSPKELLHPCSLLDLVEDRAVAFLGIDNGVTAIGAYLIEAIAGIDVIPCRTVLNVDIVVAVFAPNSVQTTSVDYGVVVVIAVHLIIAVPRIQSVVATPALDLVVLGPGLNLIVIRSAVDVVNAIAA